MSGRATWPDWIGEDGGRRPLMALVVACQMATVVITWPLWQVRATPPNLPVASWLPELPFGWLMIASLVLVLVKPTVGVAIHGGTLLAGCLFDQYRLSPQFLGLLMLMVTCFGGEGMRVGRWYLAAMWTWAGVHKLLSADWLGHASATLVRQAGFEPEGIHVTLAIAVAVVEIVLGLLAVFRPLWAARMCPIVHLGIVLYLSPVFAGRNASVIPWNLATAAVGFWALTCVGKLPRRSVRNVPVWEKALASALMLMPVGFYGGWVDRCFCHVLYSDSLPRALITRRDGISQPYAWGELAVPFPSERRLLKQYFELTASEGEKMHIYEPRMLLRDQFFVMRQGEPGEITRDDFFRVSSGEVGGTGWDPKQSRFVLARAGVKLLREDERSMIYAVAFTPETFDRGLLRHVARLPNVRQIQLAGTSVRDEDLRALLPLRLLTGLGLSHTEVTDAGVRILEELPFLNYVETEGTSITSIGDE